MSMHALVSSTRLSSLCHSRLAFLVWRIAELPVEKHRRGREQVDPHKAF